MNTFKTLLIIVLPMLLFCACNKDGVLEGQGKPQIIFDGDGSGIYTVKAGSELTIAPRYENAGGATFAWTMDGQTVCTAPSWTRLWPEAGEFYVVLTVANDAGSTSEEIKVEVGDKALPVIRLAVPEGGFVVGVGEGLPLAPEFDNDDIEPFGVRWQVDGKQVSQERSYTFRADEEGEYSVKIIASNADGSSEKEFKVTVIAHGRYRAAFTPVVYGSESTVRYTFAGRAVCLQPRLAGFANPSFAWSVDGKAAEGGATFTFTPQNAGKYEIALAVSERMPDGLTVTVRAATDIICVEQSESSRRRPAAAGSSKFAGRVFDYVPAPGQFVGEDQALYAADRAAAIAWAEKALAGRNWVSLGSFGGFVVVGFDHSVGGSGAEYDFAVEGNAFLAKRGSSNEPGIVWVMQDVNGNGLPDDEWYQLKGSEYGKPETADYAEVTYYRPDAAASPVDWTCADGTAGSIDYMPFNHTQPFYYPSWIEPGSYTLGGPMLKARNKRDDDGFWTNPPYDWGYVDNMGSDAFSATFDGVEGQFNGFRLVNAVQPDGTPVSLQYVDFVKIQNAVLAKSGPLGEISTEVLSVVSLAE